MKLSVCVDSVFLGQDFCESLRVVRDAGYEAYEFWGWWDKDMEALLAAQQELGLRPAAFCTKFFSLVEASQHEEYLAGLRESIAMAKKMGCDTLISQCGQDSGDPWEKQADAMAAGLRRAVPLLAEAEITLVIEPLNQLDHEGYSLSSSEKAWQILEEVASPHVQMLFDIYHQQITEGDILRHMEKYLSRIGHVHAAGNPGRHELYTGELHYGNIFEALRKMGYSHHIGLEYFPEGPPAEGLQQALTLLSKGEAI